MNEYDYKIGDLVVFVDQREHETYPQVFPPVGTVGKIVDMGSTLRDLLVRWPSGTTSSDGIHWCYITYVKPAAVMIVEIDPHIAELVEQNGGYCPCAIEKTEDTKCPCKDFRVMESGTCECGRFIK